MKIHISAQLKADTEAEADTFVNWLNSNYSANLIKVVKSDMAIPKAEGIFPKDWGVYFIATFQANQFLEHRTAFNLLIDNHSNKIFNFSANTSHELET